MARDATGKDGRARGGRQARSVDQVFDRKGDAAEGGGVGLGQQDIGTVSLGQGLRVRVGEGVQIGAGCNARQMRRGQVPCRQGA